MKLFYLLVLLILFCSCEMLNEPESDFLGGQLYRELSKDEIPPCINEHSYIDNYVIKNQSDYDSLKILFAPQGGYENFTSNGIEKKFKLSYQPLGNKLSGNIEYENIIIYMSGKPFYVSYRDTLIEVYSDPFYVENDSLIVFDKKGYYFMKIPASLVYSIDSLTGEITFVNAPHQGNIISLSARRLFTSYAGRSCDLNYIDLAKYSLIAKGAYSLFPECVIGIDKQISRIDSSKTILYRYKNIYSTQACGEIIELTSWIVINKIPFDYTIVFEEMK